MGRLKWDSKVVEEWKVNADSYQHFFGKLLSEYDYDTFDSSSEKCLKIKIGYSIYNASGSLRGDSACILDYAYNEQQNKLIDDIYDVLWNFQDEGKVRIGFIFLIALSQEMSCLTVPVYRVHNDFQTVFVDTCRRVYPSWEDFMKNNRLPKCFFCYPSNGVYGDGFEFAESPENKVKSKVLKTLDWTSVGAAVASAAVAISLPASGVAFGTAAVVGVASGLWGSGRSVNTLVDRKKHEQSIGLKDAESRCAWFNIAASAVGTAAVGATSVIRFGRAARFARPAMIGCGVASASIGGTSIVNSVINIAQKQKLDREDLMNLAIAAFFFTSSAYCFKAAQSLKTAQPINSRAAPPAEIVEPAPANLQAQEVVTYGGVSSNLLDVVDNPSILPGGFASAMDLIQRYGPNIMRAYNEYFQKPQNAPPCHREAPQKINNEPPRRLEAPSSRNEWIIIKNHLLERIGEKLTPDAFDLFFGDLDLHTIFDHLTEDEANVTFKLLEKQIYGDQFGFVVEILITILQIKALSSPSNEYLRRFFVRLMDEILYQMGQNSLTNEEIWEKASNFMTVY